MKKIIGVIALASVAFGAFADAEFALNYRTQATAFSRLSGGTTTLTGDKLAVDSTAYNSYLLSQTTYGGASDTISATVAGDFCGATIRIDPFPANASGKQLQINQYSGYVNIGKFTLNAGQWKDGQYVGDWQIKQDADACNLGGEIFAAYKLGNMFAGSSSQGIDDIVNFAGGDKSVSAYVTWQKAFGPKKTMVKLFGSAIGLNGKTWDEEKTVYTGFAFKADVKFVNWRTQFVAKLLNNGGSYKSVDARAFGLYFKPLSWGAWDATLGGTIGLEGADLTEANADLRFRYGGKGWSLTLFNNISHITNQNTLSSSYVNKVVGAWHVTDVNNFTAPGVKTLQAGQSSSGQKFETAMWNLIAVRAQLTKKIYFTFETGDTIYFNNMLSDDTDWYGVDLFVCPGLQIFAGGKTSVSMGVRYGVSGLGAQVYNTAKDERVSAYSDDGGQDLVTSVIIPVVMRIRF